MNVEHCLGERKQLTTVQPLNELVLRLCIARGHPRVKGNTNGLLYVEKSPVEMTRMAHFRSPTNGIGLMLNTDLEAYSH